MIREALAKLVAGNHLTEDEAATVMEELMTDQATPSQAAALLTALRMKGETVTEITGMVRVMREKALHVDVGPEVLDVVSTGGGAFDPFNISTGAPLVCAGAGVRVAKHGNRSATGLSGSADLLEALVGPFDLICANLPYIPGAELQKLKVFQREPSLALDGGPDGLALIRRLLAQAPHKLAPGGLLLIEVEASLGGQTLSLARQFFPDALLQVLPDLAGRERLLRVELSDSTG